MWASMPCFPQYDVQLKHTYIFRGKMHAECKCVFKTDNLICHKCLLRAGMLFFAGS